MTPSLKYARWERERRFLLAGAPDAAEGARVLHIEDHYVQSTRLRLRRVLQDGHDPIYKLGQKIRLDPGDPSTVAHTTLYLDRAEYDALRDLPGQPLTKTRTLSEWHGVTIAVDVFAGELEGLVLAEIELSENDAIPSVAWLLARDEVTDDECFTGGRLAGTTRAQLQTTLRLRSPKLGAQGPSPELS